MLSKPPIMHLTLNQPNQQPARLSFEAEKISMGRSADCVLPIKDRFLSRHHAEIFWQDGIWRLRDSGSANGTYLNGVRLAETQQLNPGDHILLGDTELIVEEERKAVPRFSVDDSDSGMSIAIPMHQIEDLTDTSQRGAEGLKILSTLAMELIEDRPMTQLFDFILERIMHLMNPSRVALALLTPDRKSFDSVRMRRRSDSDSQDLTISRTLLKEVVEEKKVLSFNDVSQNENLALAKSIIGQSIRSALCAPLLVGDSVLGVLYLDYLLTQRVITETDARLAAQIARVAAVKLETTRLREEAVVKARMEEELRTAYTIQSRLLPASPPKVDGYEFAGFNRPVRTVSGDYYDFVVRPDGRVYFIVGDVAGKGITAALIMASLATAFSIFTKKDPTPAELLKSLNETLAPKTAPTKFATVFAAQLDPGTGIVQFANAGHTPPVWVQRSGVEVLRTTDMVVGLFPQAAYHDQTMQLGDGDVLLLFTDGVTEAENSQGDEMGHEPVVKMSHGWHGLKAAEVVANLESKVLEYAGTNPLGDDVTILALSRR